MNIIVLGMDNTGKTTLVKMLSKELNYNIIQSKGLHLNKEEIIKYLLENINKDNNIFERFSLFDEMVYGKILRNYSKFEINEDFYNEIKNKKPIIIYCRPDIEDIFNWQNREQMEGVIDNSLKLIKEFDNLIVKIKKDFKIINWNFKKDNFDNLVKIIEAYKEK